MFVGHLATALAAKRFSPRVPFPVLVAAAQLLDIVFPLMVLLKLEQVRFHPGITQMMALDLFDYPISHSLVGAVGWATLAAGLYFMFTRQRKGTLLVGALVIGHWLLDVLSHRPDVPVLPTGPFWGLGLYDSFWGTLLVEGGAFVVGFALYVQSTRSRGRAGHIALWSFALTVTLLQVGAYFGPPPPSAQAFAATSLMFILLVPWAYWIEQTRSRVVT